ncbi:MAG: hypothetical protein ACF8OB_18720, partial [Phycisphaeraceae bacterium JB051]
MFAIRTYLALLSGSHQTIRQGLLALACVVMGCLLLMPLDDVDAADKVLSKVPAEVLPDDADLIPWPMSRYPRFAEDSVINVGPWLFDKPAGKHGHVQTASDGSIEFADGTPVRFWGTTLAFGATFPDKPKEIEVLADAIAAKGYNLVRFHHNDMSAKGLGFLQNKPKSNYLLEPSEMDRLDKFAAALYKRGIYIYLDLIDYRDLLEEDGLDVPDFEKLKKINGKGWKGLFPHPAIVNAWKRFVTEFLNHVNPYTGNRWGDEPGIVTIEIINENGLFWDWSFKLTDSMTQWHNQQWNQWLVKRYGTREKLDKVWTDHEGTQGLFANEDPTKNTVFAPRLMA